MSDPKLPKKTLVLHVTVPGFHADDVYDLLATTAEPGLIPFLGIAIGEYLVARTGLPIDFQIQRRTEANANHSGPRNPLGMRGLVEYSGDAAPASNEGSGTT